MQDGSESSPHGNGKTNILKQYRMILLVVAANLVLWYFLPSYARMSLSATGSIFKEMLIILPPMFLFVGMGDAWPMGS